MAEHGPTGPPWKRLGFEQLNGAQFALRYLRTSTIIRGEALAIVDDLIREIREEMNKVSYSPDDCPKHTCPLTCNAWKNCRARETGTCPFPTTCSCQLLCPYHDKSVKRFRIKSGAGDMLASDTVTELKRGVHSDVQAIELLQQRARWVHLHEGMTGLSRGVEKDGELQLTIGDHTESIPVRCLEEV